uniref:Ig-like domain-containing protein n=1 Tax=Mastacembelus armatus TaxID=205130 RepID=A0A7N8XUN7_9TELE
MLFLPAAALCSLVVMAAELIQDQLSLTRRAGQNVSFSCAGTHQCNSDYVYWYQKKVTETFIVILNINRRNCQVNSGYNHPQKHEFAVVKNKENGCELQIHKVKPSHAATYYCSCWKSGSHSEK